MFCRLSVHVGTNYTDYRRYYFNVMHKLVALWCFVAVPPLHAFLRPVSCYQHQASRKRANERRSSDAHEAHFQKPPVNAHFSTKPKPWSTWSPLLPHPPLLLFEQGLIRMTCLFPAPIKSIPRSSRFNQHKQKGSNSQDHQADQSSDPRWSPHLGAFTHVWGPFPLSPQ